MAGDTVVPLDTTRSADRRGQVERGVGPLLRTWRARRRMSQLDLASAAQVSTRHLSYVETGRSRPSRELVLHLARHLDVPPREQNDLLLAAGHAPAYRQFDLTDPEMAPVVAALRSILDGSEPNPTLVMDRHWNLLMANESAFALTEGVAEHLLSPTINVLRLTLHPDGLAPYLDDLDQVAAHLLHHLRRQAAVAGDVELSDLLDECESYVPGAVELAEPSASVPALPVTIRRDGRVATYLSVISTFGSALDVTTSELTIETFYDVTGSA
ncbi:helix-turn-helix domain-containing protein [Ilumatobacter nonamiensis]|uniref:helix-turn-helix domain-containing protein n=1 Tax=Ilumatobacter nonamiensis TaxID=467093 RepID=UPI0005904D23|nr:helix-turn-helix transcriptional regulator [Ilumatobacter nonamiensis]